MGPSGAAIFADQIQSACEKVLNLENGTNIDETKIGAQTHLKSSAGTRAKAAGLDQEHQLRSKLDIQANMSPSL